MNTLYIVAIIIVAFAVLIGLAKGKEKTSEYPYQAKKLLLSKAERSFYGVLSQALGNTGLIFAKVRVADAISPRKGLTRSDWQKAFNAISSKHFDFLICDPGDCSIKLAIELDDSSHNSAKAQKRDELLNEACASASLPLLRVKASNSYAIADIQRQIQGKFPLPIEAPDKGEPAAVNHTNQLASTVTTAQVLVGDLKHQAPTSSESEEKAQELDSPPCPKCGAPMQSRKAKSGPNAGNIFWGCSTFPKCRGVAQMTP